MTSVSGHILRQSFSGIPGAGASTPVQPRAMVASSFSGDSRLDLAIWDSSYGVGTYENISGDSRILPKASYSLLSDGDRGTVTVEAAEPEGAGFYYPQPERTGIVTLRGPDGLELGSAELICNCYPPTTIEFDSSRLGPGNHELTVHYAGDGRFRSMTSAPFQQRVISEKTLTTLSSEQLPLVEFGQEFTLRGDVQSPFDGSLSGSFWTFTNGVRSTHTAWGPPLYWTVRYLPAGMYHLQARYEGNASHPPSNSNIVQLEVARTRTTTEILLGPSSPIVRAGEAQFQVILRTPWNGTPGGNVRIVVDGEIVHETFADASCCSGGMIVHVTMPPLPPGQREVRADYEGALNFLPSSSPPATMRFVELGDANLDDRIDALDIFRIIDSTVAFSAPAVGPVWGDADRNGYVSAADADALLFFLFAQGPKP